MAIIQPLTNTLVTAINMPKILRGKKNEVDARKLSEFICPYATNLVFAVLEDVHSMPNDGHVGAFSFGKSFGTILGALGCYSVSIIFVQPFIWKMSYGLNSNKTLSLEKASSIYPNSKHLWRRKSDDGVAEAALIAKYGERFF